MGHTATLINDKLYILGGSIVDKELSPSAIFLSLDFSKSFDTSVLNWNDLSDESRIIPPHRFLTAANGGANNNSLFLYGGVSLNNGVMDSVYVFDTQSNSWRTQDIAGTPPKGKIGITSINYNGLIYMFGGLVSSEPENVYDDGMFVLDTINLSWRKASSVNAPSPRTLYGAVLLPNNNIIYMGGFFLPSSLVPSSLALNTVYLYNIAEDTWTEKVTSGSIPSPRHSFSCVLGLNEQRVILYGGKDGPRVVNSTDLLYVLDINNFSWNIPRVSGQLPSNRGSHKAEVIDKYMVISFGEGYKNDRDILLLDISDDNQYIWTSTFNPLNIDNNNSNNSSSSSPPSDNKTKIIAAGSGGGLLGIIIIIIVCYLVYRRLRNRKKKNQVKKQVKKEERGEQRESFADPESANIEKKASRDKEKKKRRCCIF